MSQLFASGRQSTGASASTSVLPMNIQGLIFFRIEGFYLWGDGVDQTLLESLTQRVRKFLKSPEHSRSFDEQDFTYPWASTLLAFFVKERKFLP